MSHNEVILLLGSNLGDAKKNIEDAVKLLEENAGEVLAKSKFLVTKPVEFASINNFINFAVQIRTKLSPTKLLNIIKKIEYEMGRVQDSKAIGGYQDRIIDIDIVEFSNLVFCSERLQIPHIKHKYERDFSQELINEIYLKKHKL